MAIVGSLEVNSTEHKEEDFPLLRMVSYISKHCVLLFCLFSSN